MKLIWNKIKAALDNCSKKNVYELIDENDIELRYEKFDNIYAIIFTGKKPVIILDSELPYQIKEFVLWHELGHYFMETKQGSYTLFKDSRCKELPANIFACLSVGNSVREWMQNGCPENIAYAVYDYLSQNVYEMERYGD